MTRNFPRPAGRRLATAIALSLALPLAAASAAAVEQASTAGGDEPPANWREILEQQDQRIRVLERKLEIQQEEARAAAATTPVVKAGTNGFALASRDGGSQVRLRGIVHVDNRYFLNEGVPAGAETFGLRRVRPIIEGTLGGLFDFRFTPDFGGGRTVIQDAYVVAPLDPALAVTAGKFKAPFGLERLKSAADISFVERSLVNNFVPNRDIGIQVGGNLAGGRLNYAIAVQNGVVDGGSSENNATPDVDNNNDKDVTARLMALPFKDTEYYALRGLGFGVAAGWVDSIGAGTATGSLLAAYRTPGQQVMFSYRAPPAATPAVPKPPASGTYANGRRVRFSPQGYYYHGPLGVLAEYARVSQDVARTVGTTTRIDSLQHDAWQVQASWFLTGEDNGFKAPLPRNPWGSGAPGFGAVEFVGRFSRINFDDASFAGGAASFADPADSVSGASAWGVGVNWHLTQNVKVVLDYENTTFDGGAPAGANRQDESIVFSRLQLTF